MTGLSTSAIQRRIEQQCKQPSGEIAVSDSQATKPAAATDAGRNPIYEGQFDGETPEQAAHRLHWAKAGLAMGRDVAADQHARDSAELRRLSAERDQLRAEFAALKAQPSGVVPAALIEALKYYANGDHLLLADPDAWDTCSGEPINFLHDDAGTASVEDGSIAKAALDSLNSSPVSAGDVLTSSECACGDQYPANSYGAGFMAANNGVCENCDASAPSHGDQVRAWNLAADALPACGKPVLAYYLNSHGMERRIRAMHVKRFTVEAEEFADPDTQCCEYSEQDDCYYTTEGWYELIDNWPDYASCAVIEGVITHWMPLPAAPSAGSHKEQGE